MYDKLSIILVTHNRIGSLKKCIESIFEQTKGEHEIIIIDNASSDNTFEILKKEYKNTLKLIRNSNKKSLRSCKRIGIKASSNDIIAFTDDDCIISKDWIECILTGFNHSNCDILAGPINPLKKIIPPWWWQKSLDWTIGLGDINTPHFLPLGCNVAFKKDVLENIESLDKDNFKDSDTVYTEDTSRIKSAIRKGYKIKLNELMVAYHDINPKKLSLKYILYRSWLEGRHWVQNEKNFKILAVRITALFINPFRFFITLNLDHLLRSIVSLSYIVTFLKKHAHSN